MTSACDNYLPYHQINTLTSFGVHEDRTPDFLFNYQRLYQLS